MKFDRPNRRKIFSRGMTLLTGATIVIVLIPLFAIIYEAAVLGGSVFSLGFFTKNIPLPCTPQPGIHCSTEGVGSAIQGSGYLLALASLYSVPIGLGAAIFAVEYGGERRLARLISMAADVLSGVPSIVAGMFIYAFLILYDPAIVFSVLSGSLALAVIMLPIVMRTSEEALRTVPHSVREAALALGISRWKTSVRIVLIGALPGVLTGVLLSIARAAGEAAPLLLLNNGSLHGCSSIVGVCQSLPLTIYLGATAAAANYVAIAWGAALLLIILVLGLSVASRYMLHRLSRKWGQVA